MAETLTAEQVQQVRAEAVKEFWSTETPAVVAEAAAPGKSGSGQGADPPQPARAADQKADTKGAEPDPWAGVNPALRQMFDGLTAQVAEGANMAGRLKQAESRIGALTNQLSEAKKAADALTKKHEDAPTKEQIEAAAASEAEWEEIKIEFPVWAAATDKRIADKVAKMPGIKALTDKIAALETKLAAAEGDGSPDLRAEVSVLRVELAKDMVSQRHPDWEATVKKPEFGFWIQVQDDATKAKFNSLKASDAIAVLDKFQEHVKKPGSRTAAQIEQERALRLKSAHLPNGGATRITQKAFEDMTPEEQRKSIAQEVWAIP